MAGRRYNGDKFTEVLRPDGSLDVDKLSKAGRRGRIRPRASPRPRGANAPARARAARARARRAAPGSGGVGRRGARAAAGETARRVRRR